MSAVSNLDSVHTRYQLIPAHKILMPNSGVLIRVLSSRLLVAQARYPDQLTFPTESHGTRQPNP